MAPALRIRPYKDFLTPLLHRRFAGATAVLALLCYVESLAIGEWKSLFWSWFPFGIVGIRLGLLFIPSFMIFILRVGQLHVGLRTSNSGWQTFRALSKTQLLHTVSWYLLSAWIFSEVYIWSAATSADLNRIKYMPKSERPVLNEKPIYLTSYLLMLAVVQSIFHIYFDYDQIDTHISKNLAEPSSEQNAHAIDPPFSRIKAVLFDLVKTSAKRAVITSFAAPFLYALRLVPFISYSVRTFAWSFTRWFAKIFWNLPKSTNPPAIAPFHYEVLLRTAWSGFLLVLLWEVGNTAFTIYVGQEPLKNDRPITYESRDPNGSLLTGLKGKKLQTRVFAFWELAYIAQRFQGRRKIIFEDIDRAGGTTWSQILTVCLDTIKGIEKRISDFEKPPPNPQLDPSLGVSDANSVKPLPRLAVPIKDGLRSPGDLFSSPPSTAGELLGNYARSRGQAVNENISPRAKRLVAKAESKVLTPDQLKAVSSEGFVGLFKEWIVLGLKFPIGQPWRQNYRRRVAAVVLGEPFGDVGVIVDAIDSLTRLAVTSLTEDQYGNVQRDVKLVIRTFTEAVNKIEKFASQLDFHWTDTERKRESPEVNTILAALKGGLNELVNAFGDYSEDLRLSQSEMRMAREAATPARRRPEMEERA